MPRPGICSRSGRPVRAGRRSAAGPPPGRCPAFCFSAGSTRIGTGRIRMLRPRYERLDCRRATCGRAVDALLAAGEAVNQDVRQVDGADVGDVAEPGPAVDQGVVVVSLHVRAQGVEELAAAEPVVEVVPVHPGQQLRRSPGSAARRPGSRAARRPELVPVQREGIVPVDPGDSRCANAVLDVRPRGCWPTRSHGSDRSRRRCLASASASMKGVKNRCRPGDSRSQSTTSTRLPFAARIQATLASAMVRPVPPL